MTSTAELVWRCVLKVEACNELMRDRNHFVGDHSRCGWVPANDPRHLAENGTPRRAKVKGKENAELGCTCGALIIVTTTIKPGSVIGAMDAAFQAFRDLHSEPDCLYVNGRRIE